MVETEDSVFYDLDRVLLRASEFAPQEFEPGEDVSDSTQAQMKTMLTEYAKVLVIGKYLFDRRCGRPWL